MTDIQLPRELRISARVSNERVPDAWFEIELPMTKKNSYALPVGPADEEGQLTISDAKLRSLVEQLNDLFPMDYAGLQGWSGEVRVRPVNKPAIERLRRGHDVWRSLEFYPADFDEQLGRLERRLDAAAPGSALSVEVEAEAQEGTRVTAVSLPVRDQAAD